MNPLPPQKIVGLRLCWFDVSFVRRGQKRNFRPLGSFFLVEVEFLVVGGSFGGADGKKMCRPKIVSNPTSG